MFSQPFNDGIRILKTNLTPNRQCLSKVIDTHQIPLILSLSKDARLGGMVEYQPTLAGSP